VDKYSYMQTFLKVVDEGSFVAAADNLGQSKAAVSKKVILLEQQLGVQLLQRTTRRLTLTDAGELFYDACKHAVEAVNEAEAIVAGMHAKPKGILKITSHRYFGEKYIIPNLRQFRQQCPDLAIDLELAERIPDLEKEKIDILFGIGLEGQPNLVRRRIASARHVFCASPKYLKKYGAPKKPDDLKKHCYITHSIRKPCNLIKFPKHGDVRLNPVLYLNDAQAMLKCGVDGVGIIRLHDYLVEEFINKGKLVEVLQKYPLPEFAIYVFYLPHRYVQPKIRLFLDYMYEKMRIN